VEVLGTGRLGLATASLVDHFLVVASGWRCWRPFVPEEKKTTPRSCSSRRRSMDPGRHGVGDRKHRRRLMRKLRWGLTNELGFGVGMGNEREARKVRDEPHTEE
jgi:hypothetical protein